MTPAEQADKSPVIHLIGNAHIDPAWLWRWTDGFSEVKATFQAAVDRLEEYPDFIFTCAGACYYHWVEQNCPELFQEISHYVSEGRWVPVNGWWLQPDCNIPCGESFARHAFYGQRYFLERFGMICDTGYNVDSFGHSGMLPQILLLSCLKNYVFMRPSDMEKPDLPHVFYWQSRDGSQVLTYKIPLSYGHKDVNLIPEKIAAVAATGKHEGKDMMFFYGVGNHGGGPTIALLNKIRSMQQQPGGKSFVFSSPTRYMASIREQGGPIPVVEDDLQHHAIGCYSAMLAIKKANRRAEQRLLAAERFDTLTSILFQTLPQTALLGQAWQSVLFNQFHDILAGCSIRTVYDDALERVGGALSMAGDILNNAVQKISWAIDTSGADPLPRSKEEDGQYWGLQPKGTPLVVFNPLPFPVVLPVEANGELAGITDHKGSLIPIQLVRSLVTNGANDKWNTLFIGTLPALGFATYWLHKTQDKAETCTDFIEIASDGSRMANAWTEILLDPVLGTFVTIRDRRCDRIFNKGPCSVGLIVDETHSDTWGHGLKDYRDVIGCFTTDNIRVIEQGPLRARIRLDQRYDQSTLIQDLILYADRPELEIRIKIHWLEKHRMLKLEFPLQIAADHATVEIPYGFIERALDGAEKPMQRWVDVSDDQGGVSLINDSSYGYDIQDGVLRQTVLRSPIFADHYGSRDEDCEFMEQGEHAVRFLVYPHAGDWRQAGTHNKALAFNAPVIQ
ncbi:MAG: glycoside hydrolase family 38 C-terminal domain-containing protein, partial [Bacillota bacterium]|nr:glycoside hydrolase family 38 C-terminal domain-containing protein [Bacillota bacterium]